MLLPPCKADNIYTSFESGTAYECCNGSGVSGITATTGGVLVGEQESAAAFIPGAAFEITQIDVAFWFAGPPDSDLFTMSLNGDAGGIPGPPIETWSDLVAPTQSNGFSSVVETVYPAFTVTLTPGSQYWLVASPANAGSLVAWNYNSNGMGPAGTFAQNTGSGWIVFTSYQETLAFDVEGSPVSEPGTSSLIVASMLVAVGLLVFGCAMQRRSSDRLQALAAHLPNRPHLHTVLHM